MELEGADTIPSLQASKAPVQKRPVGRPRKDGTWKRPALHRSKDEDEKIGRIKRKGNWSRRTKDYVKMVTQGKGAPCKIWSIPEKRRLLNGLKKYSHQDWDSLCKMVPSRTKEEIQEYIHNLKGGEQYKGATTPLTWAPIESWLDMSTEMVHYEQEDVSTIIGRIFSIIGNFFSSKDANSLCLDTVPDFGKIYRYLAAVMDETLSMPDLTPLESVIIVDLMHGLGDKLRMSDTSLQRKVMCWKYKMLNHKFDYEDVRSTLDRIRKALTNDFTDLQKEGNRSMSVLPSFEKSSSLPSSSGVTTNILIPPMMPPQPQQTTDNPSAVPSTSTDGGLSSPAQNINQSSSVGSEEVSRLAKKRGRPRRHDWRRPIEKPRLYTMNPFCVPIRLLRLKPLLAGAALPTPSLSITRQSTVSVPSIPSTVPNPSNGHSAKKAVSIKDPTVLGDESNSIRQVTGLYVPMPHRKNKKKIYIDFARHRDRRPAPGKSACASAQSGTRQASAHVLNEVLTTLARKKQSISQQSETQAVDRGQSSSTGTKQAFRCVQTADGKRMLVPVPVPPSVYGLGTDDLIPPPKQFALPRPCTASQGGLAALSLSLSPSKYKSPLRAPVAACSVSVGTSDETSKQGSSSASHQGMPGSGASSREIPRSSVNWAKPTVQATRDSHPHSNTDKQSSQGQNPRSAQQASLPPKQRTINTAGPGPGTSHEGNSQQESSSKAGKSSGGLSSEQKKKPCPNLQVSELYLEKLPEFETATVTASQSAEKLDGQSQSSIQVVGDQLGSSETGAQSGQQTATQGTKKKTGKAMKQMSVSLDIRTQSGKEGGIRSDEQTTEQPGKHTVIKDVRKSHTLETNTSRQRRRSSTNRKQVTPTECSAVEATTAQSSAHHSESEQSESLGPRAVQAEDCRDQSKQSNSAKRHKRSMSAGNPNRTKTSTSKSGKSLARSVSLEEQQQANAFPPHSAASSAPKTSAQQRHTVLRTSSCSEHSLHCETHQIQSTSAFPEALESSHHGKSPTASDNIPHVQSSQPGKSLPSATSGEQSHGQVAGSGENTPHRRDQTEKAKSSFKTVLAEVAAPRKASVQRSRTSSSDKKNDSRQIDVNTGSTDSETVFPSPSPASSSSPSCKLKPTKKTASKEKPQSQKPEPPPAPTVSGKKRGRPRKIPTETYVKAKKRPANFLNSTDISHMQVEYVTMSAARKRMLGDSNPVVGDEMERRVNVSNVVQENLKVTPGEGEKTTDAVSCGRKKNGPGQVDGDESTHTSVQKHPINAVNSDDVLCMQKEYVRVDPTKNHVQIHLGGSEYVVVTNVSDEMEKERDAAPDVMQGKQIAAQMGTTGCPQKKVPGTEIQHTKVIRHPRNDPNAADISNMTTGRSDSTARDAARACVQVDGGSSSVIVDGEGKKQVDDGPGVAERKQKAPPSGRKRGRPRKVVNDEDTYTKAKKRPANFLNSTDISNMKVEYVTMDEARQRMQKQLGGSEAVLDNDGQKKLEAVKKSRGDSLSVVMENEEISLITI